MPPAALTARPLPDTGPEVPSCPASYASHAYNVARSLASVSGLETLSIVLAEGALDLAGDLAFDAVAVTDGVPLRRTGPTGKATLLEPVRVCDEVLGALLVRDVPAEAVDEVEQRLRSLAALACKLLLASRTAERLAASELELRQSEYRLRELTRTVATGVAILDPAGVIREINSIGSEILGLHPETVVGRHFSDFVAPDDLPTASCNFEERLSGALDHRTTEIHVVRPSGERRLVQTRSSTLRDEAQVPLGVYFVVTDVTEERTRDIQLRRAERLASLAPLLGGVCHELNNPLTSIKSFAELMLLDDRTPEDVEALEIVRREASRAARIVTDLKLVARQTQEDGSNLDYLQINEIIEAAKERLREEIAVADVQVRLDLAPDLPRICGNRAQLERMVMQLLSNGIQILNNRPDPRVVEVVTRRGDLGVSVRVRDTGPGIDPEHAERIFDPFWTTRTTGEGTGLGLSLAHSIATDHRGQISVEGGWGTGAVFTVELPTNEPEASSSTEPMVHLPVRLPLRILIVDDEAPIRFSMMRYMARRGHTICEAEEGEKALAILEAASDDPFDIILADLRMPGLGGEQLYERMKDKGDGMEQRLIFITGDAESPEAARVLLEAGVPVVLKPFELAEIAQIIEAQADVLR